MPDSDALARIEGRLAAQSVVNAALATMLPAAQRADAFGIMKRLSDDWAATMAEVGPENAPEIIAAAEQELASFSRVVARICARLKR